MPYVNRIAVRVVLMLAAGAIPLSVAAQNFVTLTIATTPLINTTGQFAGKLTVVNNAPGLAHVDPHVDGDLVCYTNTNLPTLAIVSSSPGPSTYTENKPYLSEHRDAIACGTSSLMRKQEDIPSITLVFQ